MLGEQNGVYKRPYPIVGSDHPRQWLLGISPWRVRRCLLTRGLVDTFFSESQSSIIRELCRIAAEIAPTDIPVMIVGETGTGKEVMAIHMHQLSGRQSQPFVKLACSTLAPLTLEGLLHSTSGDSDAAHTLPDAGTVFFDEISDLDPACQTKLLQSLPDGNRLAHKSRLRVRIVSSSRRNLEDELSAGRFREELFYRLNDVCLRLPPLRDRKEDIPDLVDFFLTRYSADFGRQKPALDVQTMEKLQNYSWPGNIRQLENAVKRIAALGDERLALVDLASFRPDHAQRVSTDVGVSLKEVSRAASKHAERELIRRALERTRWNRKRAARELQISYKALLYKLKQVGLDGPKGPLDFPREQE